MSRSAEKIVAELDLEIAQLEYIAGHRWIVISAGLSKQCAVLLGIPLVVIGVLIGNFGLVRVGVFLWLLYVVLIVAGVAALLPGFKRIKGR